MLLKERIEPTEPTGRAERIERTGRAWWARWAGWLAVGAWALLIAGSFAVGEVLRRNGLATEDELPPLHAESRLLTWQILPVAGIGVLLVAGLPWLVRRLSWAAVLGVGWAAGAVWAVALALTDGLGALARPLNAPTEYPAGLAAIGDDPLGWLRTFTERLGGYPTHVRGHPPLPTLVFWGLDSVGLRGTGWAAALIIAVGASAVAAIAITVRCVAGEQAARRAVPFLALAPLALWIATAMDAFFLGVGAWGVALLAVGAQRWWWPAAFGGGLLLGALPYLSYGLLPLYAVPFAVLLLIRPNRWVIAAGVCGLVVVPLLFTVAGFWWPDGVAATQDTYAISRGSAQRSYPYFLVADLAVLGLLVGPAVAYALPSLRIRTGMPVALLAAAALLGTLALDVSGVTRGEVERIWVPYAAWIVPLVALRRDPGRGWLAAQVVTALVVQALVLSEW
ncbi:hypothetical protein J4573_09025 [Actinomadura barringtoniae]|uniref:Uncharacterized protein n=1 Tax=Actinomadura barringtoniae TaxID=1427535 RepID=A0A939P7W5_9ACTN|nr:hypothetical protein [Actinomadura barringtoniae]MBO2447225.1 hypothetical protein [Actinomadura barringtoniae]